MMKTSDLTYDSFLPRSDCYCQFELMTTKVTEDIFFSPSSDYSVFFSVIKSVFV